MRGGPLPRIILGDHGFMHGYGSILPDAEIVQLMVGALNCGLRMLSGGDFRLPGLISEAFRLRGDEPRWIMHMDAEILSHGGKGFPRAIATLDRQLMQKIGEAARLDPIMQPFLASFSDERPLAPSDLHEVGLDQQQIDAQCRIILDYQPEIVTIGGDATDALLAFGRTDLFDRLIETVSMAASRAGTKVFVCTYVGFCWPDEFQPLLARHEIAGLLVPANVAGHGMLPSISELRSRLRRLCKPVMGMHALSLGALPLEPALPEVLEWPEITAILVGASTQTHIEELATFAMALEKHQESSVHASD